MEHTSNYWKPIALTLKNAGFYVSVVNAMLIHDFSDNSMQTIQNKIHQAIPSTRTFALIALQNLSLRQSSLKELS